MRVLILGCGRMGASLAVDLAQKGHEVSVLDRRNDSFSRLGPAFSGRRIRGDGLDVAVLEAAGITEMDAFIACTSGDNRNLTASQIARTVFGVPKVVARVSDPLRGEIFATQHLETVCPTVLGADMIYNALLNKGDLVDCG